MFTDGYNRLQVGRGVRTLLIINISVFILGIMLGPSAALSRHELGKLTPLFGLSLGGIQHGMIWQFVTYMFLHADLFHIIANMLGLFFLGRALETTLGTRRFVQLYLVSGVVGGLAWILFPGAGGFPCVGASGAVFGIVCAFAAMFPYKKLTMLVYFVFPVTMTATTLALILVGGSMFMMIFSRNSGVAHSVHLAGAAAGYLYGKNIKGIPVFGGSIKNSVSKWNLANLKAWYRRRQYRVLPNDNEPSVNWSEVDSILDKIKHRGVNGLTRHEKEILDRASKSKR